MSGLRIGRIFGIDVHVHASWLIIAGLVMWSLLSAALPADFPEITGGRRLLMASTITLLFFVSLLAHELAHSVVAMARGIPVHRITFFLFGGMAQTSKDSRTAGEEFLIAIAGPVMSLLLAALGIGVWYLAAAKGWGAGVVGTAIYIGILNLVLAVFNMLPGFPMDGGRVLRSIVWKATGDVTRATRWASRVGGLMALMLMGYGVWRVVVGDVMGGTWIVFIGWFIRQAARASYRQHLMARMHEIAKRSWESRYHQHPLGPDHPARRDRPLGPEYPLGRDVTNLGRSEA